LLTNPNPGLEVRGFAELRLPALFKFNPNGKPIIQRLPQSDRPVKVLLTPEIRGTFLPNNFPEGGGDFDQISYPLELASGKGLNEIEPEAGGPIFEIPQKRVSELMERLPLRERPVLDLASLTEEDRDAALVEVISQIQPSPENLQNVSDLLSKLNIPIAMQPIPQ